MSELNKYHYMIQGILYAHLDSGQVVFGAPSTIAIPIPPTNPYPFNNIPDDDCSF